MADKLFARTQAGITPGTPLTFAHGLSAAGSAVAPDIIIALPRGSGSRPAGLTAGACIVSTGTDAVCIDLLSTVAATVDVMCEYLHSIQRVT